MKQRDKFIMALEGKQPPGRVPHFELVFFLTMEAFGRVHPIQRNYEQWDQMTDTERELHRRDIADLYLQQAKRFEQSGIFYHNPGGWKSIDDTIRSLTHLQEMSDREYFVCEHGDATYALPAG